ncbi:MAG: D-glycerate dehydrogenase [Patescibacteria group bacterium]
MKIYITRKVPGESLEIFKQKGYEVISNESDRPVTEEELIANVKGVDAILSLLTEKIDGDLMDLAGPGLKVISNYAVGFDNINIDDATKRGIVVTNTPCDEVNEAVAEHTWALILSLARRIVEADESVRRGSYFGWDPGTFLGTSLKGKTLGIVGLGRIGSMVAKRAKGYEMNLLYTKRERDEKLEQELNIKYETLENLLSQSDFLTLHVPLTNETRGMINKETLSKMKKGSYIVNTARGEVIKEDDLVEALKEGQIKGAALDVFENEPKVHPELIGMENVILTPHIGSATLEVRNKMRDLAFNAITEVLEGKKPDNIVNDNVWENRRK